MALKKNNEEYRQKNREKVKKLKSCDFAKVHEDEKCTVYNKMNKRKRNKREINKKSFFTGE